MPAPTTSPVFGASTGPKEHLTRGRGINGEVRDLREDVEAAFFNFRLPVYTNETRPTAYVGRVIWNSDDGAPNFGNGTNWVDAAGNIT